MTPDFGKLIEKTVRDDESCQRMGGTQVYQEVAGKLLDFYDDPADAHFERIYHVLHELETLRVTPGAVTKFKPVMAPFLELTPSYEPRALRAAAGTMIKCIYREVSKICDAPEQPLDQLARFFVNLEEAYVPRVYTTNYDDFVGQSTDDRYFTGFTQNHGDHAAFDATGFWSHWDSPALFHLHGSIHMGFPAPGGSREIGDIAWYAAREDALKYGLNGGSGDSRMDGTQIERSAIITGLDKLGRLQRTPYVFYYSALSRDAMEADVIFVLGSGLGDLHLNTWLKGVRRAKPWVPILYVGHWDGGVDGLYTALNFEYKDREISLTQDLRMKLYDLPGSELKALSGWTVDANRTAAVWADGFQSFLSQPQALHDAMRAIGA
ncbi:SIR2 family protein [Paraburkholderia humisilvae]|uniref:SIR2 family protein n=1 Tax=Paraburkholderia humisilvae TaxID=627669 RepID=UPI0015819C8D|nr:SIR2 family protein [Paraburkholderia humisilvae]